VSTLAATGHTQRPTFAQFMLGAIVSGVRLFILWKEIRSARRLLQAMPDGMLSDIGVSRGSIEHATAFGRGTLKGR
jgi:uncharacterized protein YjiS (DUF1127 family)